MFTMIHSVTYVREGAGESSVESLTVEMSHQVDDTTTPKILEHF